MTTSGDTTWTRRANRGFTILELALVLALISLVAVLAIPAFYGRPEVTLERAAQLLARDLRLAQHEAVRRGRDVIFELDPAGEGYAAHFADGTPLRSPVGPGPFERIYSRDAVFQGVRIGRVQLSGDPRSMRFDPLGFAHGTGAIELTFADEIFVVRVQESSGSVSFWGLHGPER